MFSEHYLWPVAVLVTGMILAVATPPVRDWLKRRFRRKRPRVHISELLRENRRND